MSVSNKKNAFLSLNDKIELFASKYRKNIHELAKSHSYLGDLIDSFPAILFALGSGYGSRRDRDYAIKSVCDGRPLRQVAHIMGLPYWMRRVPPQALKYQLMSLPIDEDFNRELSGAFPQCVKAMSNWLYFVPRAVNYCDQDFALWLAKQDLFMRSNILSRKIHALSLYAWFSKHPYYYAGSLIDKPMHNDMEFDTACKFVKVWFRKIKMELLLGQGLSIDSWLSPGKVGNYSFVPLLKPKDLRVEAKQMKNCVESYASYIAADKCRLFGIRKKGVHVGTLEIKCDYEHEGKPVIHQLKGPGNARAEDHIWRAAYKWLAQQGDYNLPTESKKAQYSTKIWRHLWKPYWDRKGEVIFLPDMPTKKTVIMMKLEEDY